MKKLHHVVQTTSRNVKLFMLLLQYPQIILPAAQKPLSVSSDSASSGSAVTAPSLSGLIAVASPPPQTHTVASTGTNVTSTVTVAVPSSNSAPVPSPATPSTPQEQPQQPILRTLTKLEDMKGMILLHLYTRCH